MIMRCHCASRRCENNSRWLVIVVGIAMSTSNEANIGCHASFQRVQVSMHKISFQLVLRVRTATHRRRRCRRRRRLIGNARDVVALAVSCTHVLRMAPVRRRLRVVRRFHVIIIMYRLTETTTIPSC